MHLAIRDPRHETTATICPDGCRDILVISDTQSERALRLTDWDFQPRKGRASRRHQDRWLSPAPRNLDIVESDRCHGGGCRLPGRLDQSPCGDQ